MWLVEPLHCAACAVNLTGRQGFIVNDQPYCVECEANMNTWQGTESRDDSTAFIRITGQSECGPFDLAFYSEPGRLIRVTRSSARSIGGARNAARRQLNNFVKYSAIFDAQRKEMYG